MKRIAGITAAVLLVALVAFGAAGCAGAQGSGTASRSETSGAGPGSAAPSDSAMTFPVTVTDDASRTVTIGKKPSRIVSLAPSDTEIATAIGVPLAQLVGVTTYDDYPAGVKALPKVGDFMTPNIEAITAARPDLILITGGVQKDVLGKLERTGAKVVVVDPRTLDGLYRSIGAVGEVTGHRLGADSVVARMKSDIASIAVKAGAARRTKAFVEIGFNPLFTVGAGTLMDDMLAAAGGKNVVVQSGYVPYSVEQLVKDDPAVYFATSGGNGDPGAIAKRPGYGRVTAIKDGRVAILDDNLVSRPGPRVVLGIEAMAKALHPDAFK
jgi:iron complex transport system substrate-binding protein